LTALSWCLIVVEVPTMEEARMRIPTIILLIITLSVLLFGCDEGGFERKLNPGAEYAALRTPDVDELCARAAEEFRHRLNSQHHGKLLEFKKESQTILVSWEILPDERDKGVAVVELMGEFIDVLLSLNRGYQPIAEEIRMRRVQDGEERTFVISGDTYRSFCRAEVNIPQLEKLIEEKS